VGFQLPEVDFAAMARAQGAEGYTVRRLSELRAGDVEAALAQGRPVLLDVHVDPEEAPPMRPGCLE
jgi:acetolactate synthase-1/2/3 large subunit